LIPLVVLVSWGFDPLALSFRPIELIAIGVAALLPALVLRTGRTTRLGGVVLLFAYSLLVVSFYLSGERPTAGPYTVARASRSLKRSILSLLTGPCTRPV
jgi:hypothetical protein